MQSSITPMASRSFAVPRIDLAWQQWATMAQVCISTSLLIRYQSASALMYWCVGVFSLVIAWIYCTARKRGDHHRANYTFWIGSVGVGVFVPLLWTNLSAVALLMITGGLLYLLSIEIHNHRRAKICITISFVVILWNIVVFEMAHLGYPVLNLRSFQYIDAELRTALAQMGVAPEIAARSSIAGSVILVTLSFWSVIDLLQRVSSLRKHIDTTIFNLQRSNHERRATQEALEAQLHEHTQLLAIGRIVHSTNDLPALLKSLLMHMREIVAYDRAVVLLLHKEEIRIVSHAGGATNSDEWLANAAAIPDMITESRSMDRPLLVADLRRVTATLSGACIITPMVVRGNMIGLLVIQRDEPGTFTEHQAETCMALAGHIAAAVNSHHLREAAAKSQVTNERTRLARSLHDSVSQSLFGIFLGVRTALEQLSQSPDEARRAVRYSTDLAGTALADMRTLIFALRPEMLATQGLIASLQSQIDALKPHYAVEFRLEMPEAEPALPLNIKEALYRAAIETVQHVLLRSACKTLSVTLDQTQDADHIHVHLRIQDDCGLAADPMHLAAIREQITTFGDMLRIDDTSDHAILITASVIPANQPVRSPFERQGS